MARKYNKLAVLAKIETVYGTDPTPTGGANAMQMSEVTVTPMDGSEEARGLILPYLGHQGVELTGNIARIQGSVEIQSSGAAGTAPAYGPLLRACGFAETVDAGVDVQYTPVSSGEESVSLYANLDGVNHILLGARGTVTAELTPQRIPRFQFTMTGLLGTIADTALPSVTLTGFIRPLVVSKANTTFSLHGYSALMERLAINLGNQVEPRFLVGYEGIQIVDRQATGEAVLEAVSLATKNWFSIAQARTRGALQLVHGSAAGKIVQIDAPAVEIGRPTSGQSQNIRNETLPLMFVPSAGNDELKLTFK